VPGRSVSSLCLLRQVSSALSRNCRNEPRPDVDEAWFVAGNSWQRNCMDSVAGEPIGDLNAGGELRGTDI
jgi:hypothetical protein